MVTFQTFIAQRGDLGVPQIAHGLETDGLMEFEVCARALAFRFGMFVSTPCWRWNRGWVKLREPHGNVHWDTLQVRMAQFTNFPKH